MKRPIIIITGSSGLIGAGLVSYFLKLGSSVRIFQRSAPQINNPAVEYFPFDLADVQDKGFQGADYLIHCAYQPVVSKQDRKSGKSIDAEATKKIIYFGRKHGVRLVFLSTTSAGADAKSYYAKQKFIIEGLFDAQKDLVLRLGLVLGKGGGLFGRILSSIRDHKFIPLIGGGHQLIQTIALEDLYRVIESGINKNITGKFTIAHPSTVTLKELYVKMAESIGVRPVFIPVPLGLTYALVRAIEQIGLRLPFTAESILGIEDLKIFDTAKDLEVFGVIPSDYRAVLNRLKHR